MMDILSLVPGDMIRTKISREHVPVWNSWGETIDAHVGYFLSRELAVIVQKLSTKRSIGVKIITSSGIVGWVSESCVKKVIEIKENDTNWRSY